MGAWAAIRYLGEAGYLRLAEVVRDTTRRFQAGIDALPGHLHHGADLRH